MRSPPTAAKPRGGSTIVSNCGVERGLCSETPTTTGCSEQTIWSAVGVNVSNDTWWRVYAERDYRAGVLRLTLTDVAGTAYTTTAPIDQPWASVANDSRFCVASLDGGQAGFVGGIDHVGVWSDH